MHIDRLWSNLFKTAIKMYLGYEQNKCRENRVWKHH